MLRLLWRILTGHRCQSRQQHRGTVADEPVNARCVFARGHDGLHGAPTIYGFGYRWWR